MNMPIEQVARPLLALPRFSKRLLAIAVDCALCALTVWFAYYLRLGQFVSLTGRPTLAVLLSIVLAIPALYFAGVYRMAFRRADSAVVPVIALACACYGLCYMAIISAYAFRGIPRTVGIIQPILLFLGVSVVRLCVGYVLGGRLENQIAAKPQGRVSTAGGSMIRRG